MFINIYVAAFTVIDMICFTMNDNFNCGNRKSLCVQNQVNAMVDLSYLLRFWSWILGQTTRYTIDHHHLTKYMSFSTSSIVFDELFHAHFNLIRHLFDRLFILFVLADLCFQLHWITFLNPNKDNAHGIWLKIPLIMQILVYCKTSFVILRCIDSPVVKCKIGRKIVFNLKIIEMSFPRWLN